MNWWISFPLILLLTLGLIFLLYESGLVTMKMKFSRALLWVGNIYKARFSKCSGCYKKVFRPKESRNYQYSFIAELSKGSISMKLLSGKDALFSLSKSGEGEIYLEKDRRYVIELYLDHADGSHELKFN